MKQWQQYSENFLKITPREQYLIVLTGIVVIVFILFNLVLDGALTELSDTKEKNRQLIADNISLEQTTAVYVEALQKDPNAELNAEIAQYNKKLEQIDEALLGLTSGLIDPVQMRFALLELLKVQKGISLQSFELVGVEKISLEAPEQSTEQESDELAKHFVLYKHGIKLKLSGDYFQLKEYLAQLESLQWRFFWQKFSYKLVEHPQGSLDVIMYSLSTQREFIGV